MRIPVDTNTVRVLAIGAPTPVLDFNTKEARSDLNGVPLYKVPVVLSGTGERVDPTTSITVPAQTPPEIKSGDALTAIDLVANAWTFRDNTGKERSGVSFRALRLEKSKPSR